MEITSAEIQNVETFDLEGYTEAFAVYQSDTQEDKQAIMVSPELEIEKLVFCASRLNQTLARMMDMDYDTYLSIMKGAHDFSARYGNLDLSEEQLEKLVDKDTRNIKNKLR